jgi:hypothetical protein
MAPVVDVIKTDGIYRYREDAPPKHVEGWRSEVRNALWGIIPSLLALEAARRWGWETTLLWSGVVVVVMLGVGFWRRWR